MAVASLLETLQCSELIAHIFQKKDSGAGINFP